MNPDGLTTFDGKGCAANKGIAVKLGADGARRDAFRHECVRMAGGWTGGWVETSGRCLRRWTMAQVHGPSRVQQFSSRIIRAGLEQKWRFFRSAKTTHRTGRGKIPLGPLPREWAKYRGLYLHGDRVVFAYSVGTAGLLESGDIVRSDDTDVLTRTFNVLSAGAASSLILAEGQNGAMARVDGDIATMTGDTKDPDKVVVITTHKRRQARNSPPRGRA
jgi:hypothetical protein